MRRAPLVVVGVKSDSHAKAVIGASGSFALNFLGKGQEGIAYAFFKSVESDDQQIGGQPYRVGTTGAPILTARSITLTIFAAFVSDSEPPKTVKSCAKANARRPLTRP